MAGYDDAQMMLGNNLYSKEIGKDCNVRMFLYGSDKTVLNFSSGIIFMVQDAEFGVTPFFMLVEITFFGFIKIHSPMN